MLDVVAPFDDGPDHKYSYGAAPPEPVAVSVTPEEVHTVSYTHLTLPTNREV